MSVTAKCVPVNIEVDKPSLKFSFDENSVDMSTKEVVRLSNLGNSEAVFKFTLAKEKLFVPAILEGKIKAKQTLEIPITFTTPEIKAQKADYNFTERLILKVLDGAETTILCSCNLHDPKFTVKPLTVANPMMCVGHEFNDVVEVKNISKHPIVLHISGKVLEISEKVKINPEEVRKFKVKYSSQDVGSFEAEIVIQPRCGISRTINTTIKVIAPKLLFSKE